MKLKDEQQRGVSIDSTENKMRSTNSTLAATSERKTTIQEPQLKSIKTLNPDDYEERQRQMRIKYGSSKSKMN